MVRSYLVAQNLQRAVHVQFCGQPQRFYMTDVRSLQQAQRAQLREPFGTSTTPSFHYTHRRTHRVALSILCNLLLSCRKSHLTQPDLLPLKMKNRHAPIRCTHDMATAAAISSPSRARLSREQCNSMEAKSSNDNFFDASAKAHCAVLHPSYDTKAKTALVRSTTSAPSPTSVKRPIALQHHINMLVNCKSTPTSRTTTTKATTICRVAATSKAAYVHDISETAPPRRSGKTLLCLHAV